MRKLYIIVEVQTADYGVPFVLIHLNTYDLAYATERFTYIRDTVQTTLLEDEYLTELSDRKFYTHNPRTGMAHTFSLVTNKIEGEN